MLADLGSRRQGGDSKSVARRTTPAAALAALGIVYGDLGTSPLYTLQTVVGATGGHFSRRARSAACR